MKKIPTSCLKSVPLYFSHHIMLKKNEKVSWGGPWECTNMEKVTKSVFTTTWHVVTEDKGLWWTLSSFLIIDIIELKPSDNISIVRSCGGVEGLPMSTQKWPKWAKMPSIGKRGKNGKKNDENKADRHKSRAQTRDMYAHCVLSHLSTLTLEYSHTWVLSH